MDKFYEILLITTSIIGIYVSIVLLFLSKHNRLLNRLLFIYTFTASVYFLLVYAMIRGWATAPVVLVRTFMPTSLINTAVGYLYFRVMLEDETKLSVKDLIHLLPFAVNLLYYSPLALDLLTGAVQWQAAAAEFRPQTYFLPFGPLAEEWIMLFRICVGTFYVTWVVIYFFQKFNSDVRLTGGNTYRNTIRWILICLSGYVLFGGSIILNQSRILFSDQAYSMANGGVNAIMVLITWNLLIGYVLMNPEILYGLPNFTRVVTSGISPAVSGTFRIAGQETPSASKPADQRQPAVEHAPETHAVTPGLPAVADASASPNPETTNNKKTAITLTEAMKTILSQMESYVAIHQPYRRQEFNIATLSHEMGVPQHHIAFIFRQVIRRSFVEYRNQLRVDHVKEAIRMGRHKQITIEAIGMDAGFSSKTTFFAVFKDLTGMTPGQYAEECGLNGES